jgi:solute:Na+ symporter, SSS family
MVQRYLTARTTRQAVRGALLSGLACVPIWGIFFFIGTALWGYYNLGDYFLPSEVAENPDRVFPYFIMTQLPQGITGLILVALFSSGISTISSGLNSLSTVFTTDLFMRIINRKYRSDNLLVPRIAVVSAGLLSVLLALFLVASTGQVLEVYFTALSIFGGGILGLMLLAVVSKKANLKGVTTGIIVNVFVVSWAALTVGQIIDMKSFNYNLHPFLIGLLSHFTIFAVGYVASLFFKK